MAHMAHIRYSSTPGSTRQISATDPERVRRAYYARAGKHRPSFSAWIVAVLSEKADKTLGKG